MVFSSLLKAENILRVHNCGLHFKLCLKKFTSPQLPYVGTAADHLLCLACETEALAATAGLNAGKEQTASEILKKKGAL